MLRRNRFHVAPQLCRKCMDKAAIFHKILAISPIPAPVKAAVIRA
jgi:hypothetical protein